MSMNNTNINTDISVSLQLLSLGLIHLFYLFLITLWVKLFNYWSKLEEKKKRKKKEELDKT